MIEDKVSIILPVYNSEKYIAKTIDSILNQNYNNYELIIIDDGSTDNSANICEKYANNEDRICLYKRENYGVSKTRNFGLSRATGKYIMFVDSDDFYESNCIKTMVNVIVSKKVDLVSCSYSNFGLSNNKFLLQDTLITNKFNEYLEKTQKNYLFNQIWNKIYKLEIIKSNKILFDENISIAEDLKFNIEYLKKCNSFCHINEVLYNYRVTTSGLGFRYRTDANDIKIELLKVIEDEYSKNNLDKKYIFFSYLKQYIAYFSNIIDNRNDLSNKQKKILIKKIIESPEYKEVMKKIKKYNNLKIKALAFILTNNVNVIVMIAKLANYYDRKNKKKIYGIISKDK